ncbi:hypothetical protein EDB83DRAFT_2679033 [Lactarius deliciosus]|nr:hypothetical protein EDB83DRAFT_2679033 [Lactarius deliciosus]
MLGGSPYDNQVASFVGQGFNTPRTPSLGLASPGSPLETTQGQPLLPLSLSLITPPPPRVHPSPSREVLRFPLLPPWLYCRRVPCRCNHQKHSALPGAEICWGMPSPVPSQVAIVRAMRAVTSFSGFDEGTTEEQLRDDLSRFGLIDQVEARTLHLSTSSVSLLRQRQIVLLLNLHGPRSVSTTDRCAYIPKSQQAAAQAAQAVAAQSLVAQSAAASLSSINTGVGGFETFGPFSPFTPEDFGVLPTALTVKNTRASIPNLIIANSGGLRFDIYAGPFTKNDQLTASPFTDAFVFIAGVVGVVRAVLPALNGEGANGRRELAEALSERYARGNVETRYRRMHERDPNAVRHKT